MTTEFIKRQLDERPFYMVNVKQQLNLLHKEEITFSKLVENLNEIAFEFYKERKIENGIILPLARSDIRDQLLRMEVGDSIRIEDELIRNRTVNHCVRISKSHGWKFTTRKMEGAWRCFRIK